MCGVPASEPQPGNGIRSFRHARTTSVHNHLVLVAELLDELAHAIPRLPDAACKGRGDEFDVTNGRDRQAIARAKAICQSCPVFEDCRDWLAGLPPRERPSGVVAGRYYAPPRLRPWRPRPPNACARAVVWLRDYMAAHGSVSSGQVAADAVAAGISVSTLHKARVELNVRLVRVPGPGARHEWHAA
jgi:Transcription factor WhiB